MFHFLLSINLSKGLSSFDLSHNTTNGNSNGFNSNKEERDYCTKETQLEKLRKDLEYIDLNFSKFEKSAAKWLLGLGLA